jgi:hypothetical protein
MPNTVHLIQLVAAVITAATAVAVVGTAGHAFNVFHTQRANQNPWWLPLWPDHFDTTSTKIAIGTGTAIAFLNLVLVALMSIPKVLLTMYCSLAMLTFSQLESLKGNALLATGISLPSILLAIASMVVANLMDDRAANTDTIRTWTCRFNNNPSAGMGLPSNMTNENFDTLCKESVRLLPFAQFKTSGVC